jgi:L-asparaginase II
MIRLGDFNLDSIVDDDAVAERRIEEIFIHPNYVKGRAYFDIALMKIEPVQFGIYIKPGKNKFFTNP